MPVVDYSKLSNDELLRIANGHETVAAEPMAHAPQVAPLDMSQFTDAQLVRISNGESPDPPATPSLGQIALTKLAEAGEFIDKYTGAPARAALQRIIRDVKRHPSMVPGDAPYPVRVGERAATAFGEQFGEDPSKAPTGKEIAGGDLGLSTKETIGLPFISSVAGAIHEPTGKYLEHVSPAGLAGMFIDISADPTNILPVGAAARLTGKVAVKATTKALSWSAAALEKVPVAGNVVTAAKSVGKNVAQSAADLINPKVANDWGKLKEIAAKNGIDYANPPAEWEFGPQSMVTSQEKFLRQGPLAGDYVEAFNGKINEIKAVTEKKISAMGGGSIPTPEQAGAIIKDGYDRSVGQFFDGLENTYNDIIKDYPGFKLEASARDALNSKLTGTERWAKGRLERGATNVQRAQAAEVLQTVGTAREIINAGPGAGPGSFKQTVELLRDVGEAAFTNKNSHIANPPDIEKLRDLYGDLSDALKTSIRKDIKGGDKVVEELEASNALLKQFFGDKALLKDLGDPKLANETVYNRLIKNGDSLKINTLWRILPAEDFQKVKAAYVGEIFQGASNKKDGGFSFAQMRSHLNDRRNVIDNLLNANEKADIAEVVHLGDRLGPMILNAPRSAEAWGWQDVKRFIQSAVTSDAFVRELKDRARNPKAAAAVAPNKSVMSLLPNTKKVPLFDSSLQGTRVYSTERQNTKGGR